MIIANRLAPARARAITWNGAGGWVIFSHERQLNFSRTVWITFHCRGTTSKVSVTSSPSLTSLPPQPGQEGGAATTRARAADAPATAPASAFADDAAHRGGVGRGRSSRELIFRGAG